jgi:cytochrome c oxidase assembly factor CtaG
MPWWVAMIVIPEMIFIVAVVALWRKRRSMAVGILLSAVTLSYGLHRSRRDSRDWPMSKTFQRTISPEEG